MAQMKSRLNLHPRRQTLRSPRSRPPAQRIRPAHDVLLLRKQDGGHAMIVVPRYWGLSAKATALYSRD